jgi:hypothetical protein
MFSIDMVGCEIIVGEWLHILGPISMYFKELTMQFEKQGRHYKLQGITIGYSKIINSHRT